MAVFFLPYCRDHSTNSSLASSLHFLLLCFAIIPIEECLACERPQAIVDSPIVQDHPAIQRLF